MAIITGITPQVKDKTRCNLEVDGRFYCGMTLETVMQYRLKVGCEVSEAELDKIHLDSEKATALDKALGYISRSMKTEKQIRTYLKEKGYLEDVCDYVVEKMRGYDYLNDGIYAKTYTESVSNRKGKRLIALELKRKGVGDEAISEALDSLEGESDAAFAVLQKYMRNKVADKKNLQKAYAYLIGKGFDYETAREALKRLGAEDED